MENVFWGIIIFFVVYKLQGQINRNKLEKDRKIYYHKLMSTKHRCVWCSGLYIRKNGVDDKFCSLRCKNSK